jgi:hypothetical protein
MTTSADDATPDHTCQTYRVNFHMRQMNLVLLNTGTVEQFAGHSTELCDARLASKNCQPRSLHRS